MLAIGLGVWILATVVLRLFGQHLFFADQPTTTAILFMITGLACFGLTRAILRWGSIPPQEAPRAALLLALPGLLLDVIVVLNFGVVYPNLMLTVSDTFAAWLLFAYAMVLFGGVSIGQEN